MAPSLQGEEEFYSCFKEAGTFCYLCFMSFMLSCLFFAALGSPAGKGLTS